MRTVALALVSMAVAVPPVVTARGWADPKPPGVRADVLAVAEGELARLEKQAKTEPGPVHPRPSSEVAYLLLTGLAAQGHEVKQPTGDELRQLGLTPSDRVRVRVFAVGDGARVAVSAEAIQDRSGYWTSKRATLYRRQGEKWVERGSGSTASDGVSLPD